MEYVRSVQWAARPALPPLPALPASLVTFLVEVCAKVLAPPQFRMQ